MIFRATALLLPSVLSLCMAFLAHAGSMGESTTSLESAADREISRREEDLVIAEQELRAGDAALQRGDVKEAYHHYKTAVDLVPQGSASRGLRSRAVSRFSSGSVRYAEYLVSRGEYAEARRIANEVLEARYNPDFRPAIVFLSRLEEADYFNKTVTPEFAVQRDEVGRLMNEAVGYYDSGRYDMAQKRYQQILAIDKDNAAAFRGLEQVELGKQRYYDSAYNETRARMLWQVERAWERPKRRFAEARTSEDMGAETRRGTELMMARLNRIIVPRVDFRDAPIQEAVSFLREQSRALDSGEGGQGINIVVEMPRRSAPVVPTTEGEESTAAPPAFSDRITLNLSNVPLYEVLRYVALQAGLKVKVEPFAVSVVPLDKMTDALEVREFKVPPGFISATAPAGEDTTTFAGGGPDAGAASKLSARQNAKDFLESQGVDFPAGASARFIPGSSRLVVKNTASNLDLIESLVEASMAEQPTQVEIEAKFVEVSQNNLKELGFDWTVGPLSIGGSGVYGGGGNGVNPTRAFPFNYPGTTIPVGANTLSGGLRSGSGTQPYSAISVNRLNALLGKSLGLGTTGGPAPAVFSVAGVFTNPQFQVLIRALNQKKGVDLMAAPKVTTKSGQKATITLSREFPYPQEFEPPQIPQNTGGSTLTVNGGATADTSDPVVTPSFPTDFTTRNLGVTLEVEPQIGPDGYTIDLNLTPEVVDFDGFINYGSPIYAPRSQRTTIIPFIGPDGNVSFADLAPVLGASATERQLLTENVINQPIFSTRKVTTNVSIWDGQTVVIGGLIREDVQKVSDKVPILGDIPVAGALFRSEVEQKIKRNLIIFTTARLMDAAGQLLRPEDDSDQEEVVEPLGLPPEIVPPRGNPKGLSRK
ncbi:MAG: Amuc_1098 family type IV pilus outer membrane protein [Chthoniobacterales bacterium]